MATWYLDPENGNDSNDGLSFANRVKYLNNPTLHGKRIQHGLIKMHIVVPPLEVLLDKQVVHLQVLLILVMV